MLVGKPRYHSIDGDQIIAEYDDSDNLQTKYIFGPGIDEPVKGLSPQGTVPEWYYHFDGLGSVTSLTDSTGSLLESYSYDALWQAPHQRCLRQHPASLIPEQQVHVHRQGEYDQETGLYYYRARYYSPKLGRFLQRDPVGYVDNINLYVYCFNDPINYRDPYGLWVAIGEKSVAGTGSHTVIIVHPDNEAEFANDPRFYRNSKGELEATLSANPSWRPNRESPLGNLIATPNIRGDRPENMRNMQRIADPLKRSDSRLINDILTSANKYKNNLPYDPTPWPFDPYYNSNSYTYGVLGDAGISKPPNLPGWQPGADKPIPLKKK